MTEPTLLAPREESLVPPIYELPNQVVEMPLESEEPESGPDKTSQFDRRYREPFIGMLYLGYLEDTFKLYGHSFKISTPTQNERLQAGILHKPYVNTVSSEQAWASLMVAAYLDEVDGTPLPQPINNDPRDTGLQEKYEWVVDNLRKEVIIQIFERCFLLDAEVDGILAEMKRLGEA